MQHPTSHRDQTRDTDYRPTRYGSTDYDRDEKNYENRDHEEMRPSKHSKKAYVNLILMGVVHIPVMYFIMFAMVDKGGDIYQNLNTFYMALMMAAPMVALMPFMMKEMYPDKKKNFLVLIGSLIILSGAFFAIRYQSAIGDSQFIRSMIPHHSGAILMCDEANISDGELKSLCRKISSGQRSEIDQMESILKRLK